MSQCRSCGAPVRWVPTPGGKTMPLNDGPDPEGNVEIDASGVAIVYRTPPQDGTVAYLPHWVTCPDSDKWRRRR